MKSRYYPPANRTKQWWENDFDRGAFTKIEKILLHTTETSDWPTYNKSGTPGDSAPTLTYKAATREWRQHNYLDTSARALGDPTSTPVRENRDNVIQIEIIWYASKIGSLPDTAYRDLAAFVAYVREEWGGPSLNIATFRGSATAGESHMSSAQYDGFNGILGHQHAPSPSTHWDPGAFNAAKLVQYVKEIEIMSTLDAEDIKNITNAVVAALPKAVWSYPLKNRVTGKSWSAGSYTEGGAIWAADAKSASEKSLVLDTANAAAIQAVQNNPNITPEALQKLVEDAVSNVVGEGLSGSLTVDFGGAAPAPETPPATQ